MDLSQALVLGLVEGATEYLPVSSTGHLLIAQRLMAIPTSSASHAYAIVIQGGAIAAVGGLYRHRLRQMAKGVAGLDLAGKRLAICIAIAFVPAALIGLALDSTIERYLFGAWPIVVAWTIGALGILFFDRWRRAQPGAAIESLTWNGALVIGLFQCVALWPGISRSLATIAGGVFAGLSLVAAVEFSFLLGLLTLTAASTYKAIRHGSDMLQTYEVLPMAVGFLAAWIAAVVAVRWLISMLSRQGLVIFAWWRLAAAAIVVVMLVLDLM